MQPEASRAEPPPHGNAGAAPPRGATRFQYGTGDKPLSGYTIKRGVGRGGFGEVYFATSDAGKEVALKLIRRNLDVELRGVRQCLNLKHPNLVALYDLRSDGADDQWVVMEFVSGESLEDAIRHHPNGMPAAEAASWLRGIAAGVAHLHASGIVHRDLKPANIYLERGAGPIESRVKIGDYGLSKFLSSSRRSGQTESVGTVHYMAPEIAGGRYGREIDTYALGVILYEMLTGRVPFEGESVGEVLMKHLTAEPDLARVAEPYRSIVAGALAKDPELRLASVDAMVAMLPGAAPASPTPAARNPPTPVLHPAHTVEPAQEPLLQGLRELAAELLRNTQDSELPALGKGLALFGVVAAAVLSFPVWVTFVVPVGLLYGVYYVVWSALFRPTASPGPRAPAADPPRRKEKRRSGSPGWRALAMRERRERPLRAKAASLTGSLLVAALVTVGAAVVAPAVVTPLLKPYAAIDKVSLGLWLACVGSVGAWGVLLAQAFTARHFEDGAPRRGLNLLVGAAVGLFACGLEQTLVLSPGWHDLEARQGSTLLGGLLGVDADGGGFQRSAVYFAVAFLLVGWWKSTDYLRSTRLGLWHVAGAAIAGWVTVFVVPYPQPAGVVAVALISVAVQAASPWCPPSRREALALNAPREGFYDS